MKRVLFHYPTNTLAELRRQQKSQLKKRSQVSQKSITRSMQIGVAAVLTVITCCIFGAIGVLFFAPAPTAVVVNQPDVTPTENSSWQNIVDSFVALHEIQTPWYFLQEKATKSGTEFDVNQYFQVFKHLSMEPDYVLDYVYFYRGGNGEPILYARRVDVPAYRTYSEYEKSPPEDTYLNHIKIDGTREGFFQFVVMKTLGGQFYREWHGLLNDTQVIASHTRLESVSSAIESFCGEKMPADLRQKAQSLTFEPEVEIKDDIVLVKIVTFSKWSGFSQISYSIKRSFPHTILQEKWETLAAYECRITF
jgi:hypothetical protein